MEDISRVVSSFGNMLERYFGQLPSAGVADHAGVTSDLVATRAAAAQDSADVERGQEAISGTEYLEVNEQFDFPAEIREKFADPDHRVIIVPDTYNGATTRTNIGDAIPDISHGGMISTLLRAHPAIADGVEDGTTSIVSVNTGSDPEAVNKVLEAIPDNHRSDVIVSLSIGTTGDGTPWQPVVDRLSGLAQDDADSDQQSDGGRFNAFIAQGNTGVLDGSNKLAKMAADIPGVHTTASSYAQFGKSDDDPPLSASSSIIGPPSEQDPTPSTITISPSGDLNGDGVPDINAEIARGQRVEELSKDFGSAPASSFIGQSTSEAFATAEQRQAVLNGTTPENGTLYSLETLLKANQLPDTVVGSNSLDREDLDKLTSHLPNPDPSSIYVDPVALNNYIGSTGAWNGVVFFEASPSGHVQQYGGANGVDDSIIHSSTSYAVPIAIGEFIAEQREAD